MKSKSGKTGPKTMLGKSVSSMNATRHDLLSLDLILRGESQDEFDQLLMQLTDELEPTGLMESTLVEKIAICISRQRRLVRAEKASIELSSAEDSGKRKQAVAAALGSHTLTLDAMVKENPESEFTDEQLVASIQFWEQGARLKILIDQNDLGFPDNYLKKLQAASKSVGLTPQAFINGYRNGWPGFCNDKIQKLNKHLVGNMLANLDALAKDSLSIPPQAETLARYQSSLDNEFNKAFKAFREAQAWRREKQLLEAVRVNDATD